MNEKKCPICGQQLTQDLQNNGFDIETKYEPTGNLKCPCGYEEAE
jgi:hypothetical protein